MIIIIEEFWFWFRIISWIIDHDLCFVVCFQLQITTIIFHYAIIIFNDQTMIRMGRMDMVVFCFKNVQNFGFDACDFFLDVFPGIKNDMIICEIIGVCVNVNDKITFWLNKYDENLCVCVCNKRAKINQNKIQEKKCVWMYWFQELDPYKWYEKKSREKIGQIEKKTESIK